MIVKVHQWTGGVWTTVDTKMIKLTKLHVVTKLGSGTQKFNRRTGRLVGGMTGMVGMTNSRLAQESIEAIAASEGWR